ncbi:hypothetical protein AB4158_08135 [Vibrio splendidus]
MNATIANTQSSSNLSAVPGMLSHENKSCEKPDSRGYTLADLELKLNVISNISEFLGTGDCPKDIGFDLHDHMHSKIEELQSLVKSMRGLSVRQ